MRSTTARDAQDRVAERSAALRKIERDFIELNTLSQEVAQLVHLQEPMVENIEEKTKEVADDTLKANEHLDKGITSARNARKWKWWALFIVSKSTRISIFLPILDRSNGSSSHHCDHRGRVRGVVQDYQPLLRGAYFT